MKTHLIQLAPEDPVAIVLRPLTAGQTLSFEGTPLEALDAIPVGHKLALRPIAAGEPVLRFGVSIGSASEAIPRGAWVHTHNLKSDYIPTFTFADDAFSAPAGVRS